MLQDCGCGGMIGVIFTIYFCDRFRFTVGSASVYPIFLLYSCLLSFSLSLSPTCPIDIGIDIDVR